MPATNGYVLFFHACSERLCIISRITASDEWCEGNVTKWCPRETKLPFGQPPRRWCTDKDSYWFYHLHCYFKIDQKAFEWFLGSQDNTGLPCKNSKHFKKTFIIWIIWNTFHSDLQRKSCEWHFSVLKVHFIRFISKNRRIHLFDAKEVLYRFVC